MPRAAAARTHGLQPISFDAVHLQDAIAVRFRDIFRAAGIHGNAIGGVELQRCVASTGRVHVCELIKTVAGRDVDPAAGAGGDAEQVSDALEWSQRQRKL